MEKCSLTSHQLCVYHFIFLFEYAWHICNLIDFRCVSVLNNFRYKYSQSSVSPKEMTELNKVKVKQDVTIEDAYEKVKTMDIDNWEQVRGPRPWEEEPHQPSRTKVETAKPKT